MSEPPKHPSTSPSATRRAWQLPRGVSSGTWDYVAQESIATEYDSYHGQHPLMKLDVELLDQRLTAYLNARPGRICTVADFGCGTGRIARQLHERFADADLRTINVDLSRHMLRAAASRCSSHSADAAFVQSNLVELNWLASSSIDVAVCLFSSIGMIRGRRNRVEFLTHVRRVLKADGWLLLHVHNRGHSWLDPQGPAWLVSTWLKSLRDKQWEFGDRVYVYRGLPRMFLHIYSRAELSADLRAAGFAHIEILPIDLTGSRLLPSNSWPQYLRAGGFFTKAVA